MLLFFSILPYLYKPPSNQFSGKIFSLEILLYYFTDKCLGDYFYESQFLFLFFFYLNCFLSHFLYISHMFQPGLDTVDLYIFEPGLKSLICSGKMRYFLKIKCMLVPFPWLNLNVFMNQSQWVFNLCLILGRGQSNNSWKVRCLCEYTHYQVHTHSVELEDIQDQDVRPNTLEYLCSLINYIEISLHT